MSLQRELAVLVCALFSVFFLLRASFLFIESLFITPAQHPLLQAHAMTDLPPTDSTIKKQHIMTLKGGVFPFKPSLAHDIWQPLDDWFFGFNVETFAKYDTYRTPNKLW